MFTNVVVHGKGDGVGHPRVWNRIEEAGEILLLKIQFDFSRDLFKLTLYILNDGLNLLGVHKDGEDSYFVGYSEMSEMSTKIAT